MKIEKFQKNQKKYRICENNPKKIQENSKKLNENNFFYLNCERCTKIQNIQNKKIRENSEKFWKLEIREIQIDSEKVLKFEKNEKCKEFSILKKNLKNSEEEFEKFL